MGVYFSLSTHFATINSLCHYQLTLKTAKIKIVGFENSIDLNEAAQIELPHLDLCCLLSSLQLLGIAWRKHFFLNLQAYNCHLLFRDFKW